MSDEELVDIIRKSSDPMQCNEMTMLIYRYTRTIGIKAVKLRVDGIEAEDLQQEGYIALFDAVRSYDPEKGAFSTFAGKCISNRMKNAAFKAHGKLEKADDYDVSQVMDDSAATDDYVIFKECDKEINGKLASALTEMEYSVLKLYLEGYSYKQIAEMNDVPLKSVDNSLSRTRKKLREILSS